VLNEIITQAAVTMQQPPADKGRMLKIYYATQTGVKPPTFVTVRATMPSCSIFPISAIIENQTARGLRVQGHPAQADHPRAFGGEEDQI
jgi:GTP-binding protein